LSGGQRQRVAIARCLVREQPILLLDEPFSALDPALRIEMLALLEQLCDEKNLTLLMVSHSLEDAVKIASRAIVIDNGTIVYDGNTLSLINGEVDQSLILGIPFN
ncbi:ATP-binding cassette domain-containing protein, partial [Salmonella enterica subsp. enterica serovar Typhimurium]|nr:ATP-binding cassette domain-containing protein [Salmonella enterica subsp. enterica serovar Typhimurium]